MMPTMPSPVPRVAPAPPLLSQESRPMSVSEGDKAAMHSASRDFYSRAPYQTEPVLLSQALVLKMMQRQIPAYLEIGKLAEGYDERPEPHLFIDAVAHLPTATDIVLYRSEPWVAKLFLNAMRDPRCFLQSLGLRQPSVALAQEIARDSLFPGSKLASLSLIESDRASSRVIANAIESRYCQLRKLTLDKINTEAMYEFATAFKNRTCPITWLILRNLTHEVCEVLYKALSATPYQYHLNCVDLGWQWGHRFKALAKQYAPQEPEHRRGRESSRHAYADHNDARTMARHDSRLAAAPQNTMAAASNLNLAWQVEHFHAGMRDKENLFDNSLRGLLKDYCLQQRVIADLMAENQRLTTMVQCMEGRQTYERQTPNPFPPNSASCYPPALPRVVPVSSSGTIYPPPLDLAYPFWQPQP